MYVCVRGTLIPVPSVSCSVYVCVYVSVYLYICVCMYAHVCM